LDLLVIEITLQNIVAMFVSVILLVAVYRLARNGRLSFRFAFGWFAICALGLASSLFVGLVKPIADYFLISPVAVFASVAVVVLVAICIQLSISISGLQAQVRRLVEEIAMTRIEFQERSKKDG